jgi:hypothetical protein
MFKFMKGERKIMLYCEHCRVGIKGIHSVCPLCGGILENQDSCEEDMYPQIPTIYQEFNAFIRTMILISIATAVVSFAVNFIFTKESRWSFLVAAGISCMWISLFIIIRKKNNIPKTILWQVALISIFAVLWDRFMGWRGWSIDYVLPSIYIGAMIVMAVAAKILKIGVGDLVVYMLVDGVFGLLSIVFIFFGCLNVLLPTVICVTGSIISLSALLLFEGDNIKEELNKRMHI